MPEFDEYTFLVILGVTVLFIFICYQSGGKRGRGRRRSRNYRGADAWVSPELFQNAKSKIKPYCSHKELNYNYKVINGPILRYGNVAKEYDHIVVGNTGVFCIETKAFGMSYGNPSKATLFIDAKDTWILSKKKKNYKSEKELVSPTNQILEEKKQLEKIIGERSRIPVHPILVLSNSELSIRNNAKLPYTVVRIDELCDFIIKYNDYCQDVDMFYILKSIDKSRVN